ncbi:MAG: sulfur carrier protein ThiS [Gemmataceae bacterium]
MIEVWINGEPRSFPGPLSVGRLIEELGMPANRVAVEVDLLLVPRSEHAGRMIAGGEKVEIVTLVGGGSEGGTCG